MAKRSDRRSLPETESNSECEFLLSGWDLRVEELPLGIGWMFPGDELGQEGHFPERVTQRKQRSWSQEWECTRSRAVGDFRVNSDLGGYGS